MSDWQFDLVRSVLDSADWVGYVQNFTEMHHSKWARRTRKQRAEGKFNESKRSSRETKVGGYSHQQYQLFQEFSQFVDSLVSSKLSELGVTEEDFFKTCEELVTAEATGPREGMFKETLRQLLSYTSFDSFCEMMQQCYDEYEGGVGFSRPAAERRFGTQQQNEDYELQLALAESKRQMEESKIQANVRRQEVARGRRVGGASVSAQSANSPPAEWNIQVATAQSIVKAASEGKLGEEEHEVFTPWAEKVLEINEVYARIEQEPGSTLSVYEQIQELNMLRLKVDLLVAQQMTKENEQRRRELNQKVENWHEEMISNPTGNQQEIIDRAEATLDDLLARVAGVHEEVSCHRRQFACNCPAG